MPDKFPDTIRTIYTGVALPEDRPSATYLPIRASALFPGDSPVVIFQQTSAITAGQRASGII